MPAARFFSMLRAARRIEIMEKIDSIEYYAIPLTNAKYCKELRDSLTQEMDMLIGFDPSTLIDEPKREMTDEDRSKVHMGLMETLAMRRRLSGIR